MVIARAKCSWGKVQGMSCTGCRWFEQHARQLAIDERVHHVASSGLFRGCKRVLSADSITWIHTSMVKSTWPGVSMMLMCVSFHRQNVAADCRRQGSKGGARSSRLGLHAATTPHELRCEPCYKQRLLPLTANSSDLQRPAGLHLDSDALPLLQAVELSTPRKVSSLTESCPRNTPHLDGDALLALQIHRIHLGTHAVLAAHLQRLEWS